MPVRVYRFAVVSLLPELVDPVVQHGVVGRARARGLVEVNHISPRTFTADRHRTVDDRPYGGGPGMVLRYEPMRDAIREARRRVPDGSPAVLLSAQGRRLDQDTVVDLTERPGLVLVCGRYEGVDERVAESQVDMELSLGDYVVSGGELAAGVIIDAVVRLLPGVLGHEHSSAEDSFMGGLLDYPQYTRPERIDGLDVPAVLLGGNHAAVRRWRLKQALGRTWLRRPDLLEQRGLDEEERALLEEFITEQSDTPTGPEIP